MKTLLLLTALTTWSIFTTPQTAVEHPLVTAYNLIQGKNFAPALTLLRSFNPPEAVSGYHLYLLGLAYLGQQDYSKAEEHLQKSYQLLPDRSEPALALVRCLRLKKDYPAALALLRTLTTKFPRNSTFFYEELQIYWELQLYRSALEVAQLLYLWEEGRPESRFLLDTALLANNMGAIFYNFYQN